MINKNTYDEIDICVAKMTRFFFSKKGNMGNLREEVFQNKCKNIVLFHIQKD